MKNWLNVEYQESSNSWTAQVKDVDGNVTATFRYNAVKSTKAKKTSGVVGGSDKRADEDYKGTGVVSPKTPLKVAAEAQADWERKNLIEMATKPYEAP